MHICTDCGLFNLFLISWVESTLEVTSKGHKCVQQAKPELTPMFTEDFIDGIFWCSVVIPDSETVFNVSVSSKIQGKSHPCQYLALWSSCRPPCLFHTPPAVPSSLSWWHEAGTSALILIVNSGGVCMCVYVQKKKKTTLHGHRYECLCSCCFSVVASWCGAFTVACSFVKALNAVCY